MREDSNKREGEIRKTAQEREEQVRQAAKEREAYAREREERDRAQITHFSQIISENSKALLKNAEVMEKINANIEIISDDVHKLQDDVTEIKYRVKINTAVLNVRKEPNASSRIVTQVRSGEVYTIVEEKDGWGKLLSGAGWVKLSYTKRL